MYLKSKTMSERLVAAKMAINNSLAEADIKDVLQELGFDEARLQAGLDLYKETEKLYQEQKREYSDQYAATEEFNNALQEAKVAYKKYTTAAKLALLDSHTLKNSLGLNQGPQFTISDWLTQGRLFYTSALQSQEVLETLQEFAVTPEKLQAGLQLVDTAEELYSRQQVEISEAQQATRDRDAAFAELDRFMYKLNKVARVLLTEKPEHLEKLGILERSAPIPKKKEPEAGQAEPELEPELEPAHLQPEIPVIPAQNAEKSAAS